MGPEAQWRISFKALTGVVRPQHFVENTRNRSRPDIDSRLGMLVEGVVAGDLPQGVRASLRKALRPGPAPLACAVTLSGASYTAIASTASRRLSSHASASILASCPVMPRWRRSVR